MTVPLRLSVSAWSEPNPHPAYSEDPSEMDDIVNVRELNVNRCYVLLRYSSYEHVPTRGHAEDFLLSNYDVKHEFISTETVYVYEDPKKIPSTGSVYIIDALRSQHNVDHFTMPSSLFFDFTKTR